jgi:hypothetical protein
MRNYVCYCHVLGFYDTNYVGKSINKLQMDIELKQICMYVYSRGGPHTALAPRPSLIYCASPLINPLSVPHFE